MTPIHKPHTPHDHAQPVAAGEGPLTRTVEVEIPAEAVARQTDAVVQRFQQHARIPGFRKGKVPASIIRQRFADEVRTEVLDALVPKAFYDEAARQKLQPVSQPRITGLEMTPGEPIRFKASFDVLPEIEISGYEELRPEPPQVTVTDEEIEQAVQHLREQRASYSALDDRPVQDGDFVQVSLTGSPVEVGGEGGSAGATEANAQRKTTNDVKVDDVLVEVGGQNTVKEFSENLRGAAPGEERNFEVRYPDDFSDQRLAGRTFRYAVKVLGIKQKTLPELDDAFAKELGEFPSLEELRGHLRARMEAERRHNAEHEAKEKLIDELLRRHDFPVPESLVDRQVDLRLERGLRALAAQGMTPEQMKQMDIGRLRAGQREAAAREVKASLLLEKIADSEEIQVSEEEVENELQSLARQSGQPLDQLRARLTREGALDRIRNRIRSEKTLDFLYRKPA